MIRGFLYSFNIRSGITCAWLLGNMLLISLEGNTLAWAADCTYDVITNSTDCATVNNVSCELKCNNPCPAGESGKDYTGNSHDVHVTGGTKEVDGNTVVHCWDDYSCTTNPVLQNLCTTSPAGTKYCDPNNPNHICTTCDKGTPTMRSIRNDKVKDCTNE